MGVGWDVASDTATDWPRRGEQGDRGLVGTMVLRKCPQLLPTEKSRAGLESRRPQPGTLPSLTRACTAAEARAFQGAQTAAPQTRASPHLRLRAQPCFLEDSESQTSSTSRVLPSTQTCLLSYSILIFFNPFFNFLLLVFTNPFILCHK